MAATVFAATVPRVGYVSNANALNRTFVGWMWFNTNLPASDRQHMKRDSRTTTIAYFLFLTAAFAIALTVWRITDEVLIALWMLASGLLFHRLLGHPTSKNPHYWFSSCATLVVVAGAMMILGVNAYATRLYFADELEANTLPGLEWCSGHEEHSLFLVIFAVLANGAVPRDSGLQQKAYPIMATLKAALVVVAFTMLCLVSVDVSAIPTLTDLSIENLRERISEVLVPGASIEADAVPRTTSETYGFIATTLATTALALVGLVVVVTTQRPRRMLGVVLTVPGGIWLLSVCVGQHHRLSPYLFGAIAETFDPVVICLWLSACALAAFRLATKFDQSNSPDLDSSFLLDISALIASSYTLYERRVVQSVLEGGTSLTDGAGSLSTMFVDIAALVVTVSSLRNIAARLIGVAVNVPMSCATGDILVLLVQLVLIGPLCVLAGAVYWIIVVG